MSEYMHAVYVRQEVMPKHLVLVIVIRCSCLSTFQLHLLYNASLNIICLISFF